MIDYHCHLLPGIDDGPAAMDESLEMAAALHQAGFRTIYCTPHLLKGHYDVDNKAVLSALSELRKRLSDERIDLDILPGREYYLDEFLGHYLKHPMLMGKTKYIMVEIPNYAPAGYVKDVLDHYIIPNLPEGDDALTTKVVWNPNEIWPLIGSRTFDAP